MVCDDCMTAAYDLGTEDEETQEDLCREMGADMPDHCCETTDEPDSVPCDCACH